MEGENKKFSCVLCGNKLSSKEELQEHFRKHANKEIDNKGRPIFKAKTQDEDKNKLTGSGSEVGIQCEICLMNFATVTLAIQHKFRKHPESSLKYYCPFCGMQFPLKFTRDKHLQSHQGMSTVGSFLCSDCGVIFHNMGAHNYHSKSTHKRIQSIFKPVPTPPPSKKIKINNANEAQSVYYCYLCGTEYIIKFNLQKHLERAHTEEERNTVPQDFIKCTTCDALFYNKKAYEIHNMYHKPDDLYVVSEEQRLQTVTRVDQDFDIRRVQLTADKFIPIDKPKHHRKKIINPTATKAKGKSPFIVDLNEELSPTSSIDSSDSEEEKSINKNDKTDVYKEELTVKKDVEVKTYVGKPTKIIESKEQSDSTMSKIIIEKSAGNDIKTQDEILSKNFNQTIIQTQNFLPNESQEQILIKNKKKIKLNKSLSGAIIENKVQQGKVRKNLTAEDMKECTVVLNKIKSINKETEIIVVDDDKILGDTNKVINKSRKRKISEEVTILKEVKKVNNKPKKQILKNNNNEIIEESSLIGPVQVEKNCDKKIKSNKKFKKQTLKKKMNDSNEDEEIIDVVNCDITDHKNEDVNIQKVIKKPKNIMKVMTPKKSTLKINNKTKFSTKKVVKSKDIEISLSDIKNENLNKKTVGKKVSKISKKITKIKEELSDSRKTRSQAKIITKQMKNKLKNGNESKKLISKKRTQKKNIKRK